MDPKFSVHLAPAGSPTRPLVSERKSMRSPRLTFVMVAVAVLASVVALTAFAGDVGAETISARGERAIPPEGCPPGWEQATHPLNPQLGCLPTHEQAENGAEESDPNPGDCPEGFVKATSPLNPALGCIADTLTGRGSGEFHPGYCPEGWIAAEPPLNPALGCVAGTLKSPYVDELAVPTRRPVFHARRGSDSSGHVE